MNFISKHGLMSKKWMSNSICFSKVIAVIILYLFIGASITTGVSRLKCENDIEKDEAEEASKVSSGDNHAPGEDNEVVFLVHASGVHWEGLVPMKEKLQAEGFEVILLKNPNLFTFSIEEGAEFVKMEIDTYLANNPDKKIKIVAACNGGVVTHYYLKKLIAEDDPAKNAITHFVNFHSAHHGSKAWLLWVLFSGPALNRLEDLLRYIVPVPEDLNEFETWVDHILSNPLKLFLIRLNYAAFHRMINSLNKENGIPPLESPTKNLMWDDETIREFLLTMAYEVYVYREFFVNTDPDPDDGREPTYEIFYQEKYLDGNNTFLNDVDETPYPSPDIKVTAIYSCMDYVMIPYYTQRLKNATNVLVCPCEIEEDFMNMGRIDQKQYDERIDLVSGHWSMYYQKPILDRIIQALKE